MRKEGGYFPWTSPNLDPHHDLAPSLLRLGPRISPPNPWRVHGALFCPKSWRENQLITPGHRGTCLTAACGSCQVWAHFGLASQGWGLGWLGLDLQSWRKTLPPNSHAGFLCLRSENVLVFVLGITILGVCHYTLTVKGSHLATHGALTESKRWSKIWALFFVEVSLKGMGAAADTKWATSLFCASMTLI